MVEAVFTTYDHDRDGYISHTEFEEIAQNFPFIDTFTVLDADQYDRPFFSLFVSQLRLF